jgi:hypothetical protein
MRTARLLPLLTLVGLTAAAPAFAAAPAGWTTPEVLAQPAATQLAVAGSAQAEAFAWTVTSKRTIRTRSGARVPATYVRARMRLPGGRLGTARAISATNELVSSPAVALDDVGNATAVWVQAGQHNRIMASFRPHGGRFGASVEIGRTSAFASARPQIAVAERGAATIAWNGGNTIEAVRRPRGSCAVGRPRGCFGAPQRFSVGTDQAVAISPGGRGFLVWAANAREGGEVHTRLRIAVAQPGHPYGHSQAITTTGDASQPAIAVLSGQSAVVAWRGSLPAGGEQNSDATIFAAERDADGTISAPQAVSAFPGSDPQLGTNEQGEAILAWDERNSTAQNPDGGEVAAAVRPPSAQLFGAPMTISASNVYASPASLTVDTSGGATLVFTTAPGISTPAASNNSASGPVALSYYHPSGDPGFVFSRRLPDGFTDARVLAAGQDVSIISGGDSGSTLISDPAY